MIQQLAARSAGDAAAANAVVSFRDSKLTRILQPMLLGNARMAMACCVTPSAKFGDESRSTLQFAQRAAQVRYDRPKVNEVLDERTQLKRTKRQLAELEARMREQAAAGGATSAEDAAELRRLRAGNDELAALVAQMEAERREEAERMERLKDNIASFGPVSYTHLTLPTILLV